MKLIIKAIIVLCLIINLPYKKIYIESLEQPLPALNTSIIDKDKTIYIYNTHQSEKYESKSVKDGSLYLKTLLEKKGYKVDYEQEDFELYKLKNNIDYSYSYTVSKKYLNEAIDHNGEYDLVIDYHRDSLPKELSSITHDNMRYAKILFVVGKGSSHYESVNKECKKLSDILNKMIPGISKGIMIKQSDYNQGTTSNMMLIEVGADKNTYEEVTNTLKILSLAIDEYLSL